MQRSSIADECQAAIRVLSTDMEVISARNAVGARARDIATMHRENMHTVHAVNYTRLEMVDVFTVFAVVVRQSIVPDNSPLVRRTAPDTPTNRGNYHLVCGL